MRDVADAQNMADILVRSGENRPEEVYWKKPPHRSPPE